jgi:cysteine desulfurase/selenocysteine lyase
MADQMLKDKTAATLEMTDIRGDFPALQDSVNNYPICFLDTAASAQKPQQVLEALRNAYADNYANIHRGLYTFSQNKTREFEDARAKVAGFLNAARADEIVFTRNSTEAINLVANSWAGSQLGEGDEIVLTEMEHHANIVPWQFIRDHLGVKLRIVPVLDNGELDFQAFQSMLSPKTRLIALVHTSNALGTINPVARMITDAKAYNDQIRVLVDASQAVVHAGVDVRDLDADFLVFTGHKLYGPTGIGVLYAKQELLEAMPPYQRGGDMIETVDFDKSTFKAPPQKFEAGTPAFAEAIALGSAIDYVRSIGIDTIAGHERELLEAATDALSNITGLRIYGEAEDKAAIVSFNIDGIHHSDIAMILDQMGIAIRTGHHCCMPLMTRFGIDGTARASFGAYNTMQDVKRLKHGVEKAVRMLA